MSRTPEKEVAGSGGGEAAGGAGPFGEYIDAWERVAEMIRAGRSFSGHERDCCFLNTGGERFADVSAAVGLDHADDGRAVALADWDHDGDVDLWVTYRTGPRVRFLRNDLDPRGRFLQVRLAGDPARRTNRDAAGARVEVHLGGPRPRKLVQTLYAGDAFLSQSTKWLHFGLGKDAVIEKLVVRWPAAGAPVETFTGLEPDRRYVIAQGTGRAEPAPANRGVLRLAVSALQAPPLSDRARIRFASPRPLTALRCRGFDGKDLIVGGQRSGPLLVNLWATWCAPCLGELREFTAASRRFREGGIEVIALNVDALASDPGADRVAKKDAASVLAGIGFPFSAGNATSEVLQAFDAALRDAIYRHRPLPVPSSFLLDAQGRLAAAYRGPVEVSRVLADAKTLSVDPGRAKSHAVPFPGRWSAESFVTNPIAIADVYLEGAYLDDAKEYLDRFLAKGPASGLDERTRRLQLADVYFYLGRIAHLQGRAPDAVQQFEAALGQRPGFPPAAGALARLRAASEDASVRDGAEALRLARLALESGGEHPAALDTLAAAYAESGDFASALQTAQKAFELARAKGAERLAAEIARHRSLYEAREPLREAAGSVEGSP